jgi:hypothetical protein
LEHQKKFTGRPDDAKIMGDEVLVNTKESVDSGRVSLNSKAAADSLITEQKKVAQDTIQNSLTNSLTKNSYLCSNMQILEEIPLLQVMKLNPHVFV